MKRDDVAGERVSLGTHLQQRDSENPETGPQEHSQKEATQSHIVLHHWGQNLELVKEQD